MHDENKMQTVTIVLSAFIMAFSSAAAATDQASPPSPHNPDSYIPYMQTLIETANREAGLPFKAMIIDNRDGSILCRGSNNSRSNPLLHGEVDAINSCAMRYGNDMAWQHATLISTAEPCPMCTGATLWSRIPIIVYGSSIPTLIKKGWSQINLRAYEIVKHSAIGKPQVIGGVLEAQTDALFRQRGARTPSHSEHDALTHPAKSAEQK